jgi:predicted transglutaminase-like cysteine proteinase
MKCSYKVLLAAAIAGWLAAPAALANCRLPSAPSKIPDGATASEQQMITAMQTIKEYNRDVQTYLKCLDFEVRQNRLSPNNQVSLHNAALSKLEEIATEFNHQVKIFKSKHS